MASPSSRLSSFHQEVASRFGLVPNFFASAPDAPEIIEKLWDFAKSAYLDNPIPAVFKERLFTYLSRFCEVRYCIARHCGFLLGNGHSSGDPSATPHTVEQAIRLLMKPTPWQRDNDAILSALESAPVAAEWPQPDTDLEDQLFSAASLVFVQPARSDRARRALRHVLGGPRSEYLLALLAFIRTAHYWTIVHPDLILEDDLNDLLAKNEELARLLLQDPEAARCDMGVRLFSELEDLRGLHERRELERANRELELLVAEKDLLLKEVNHRVKNGLQIVSSLLQLQLPHMRNPDAASALRNAATRVLAVAAVHERLYSGSDVRIVELGTFLRDLTREIGRASGSLEAIEGEFDPIDVHTDMAVPIALILNELVTNAIKHAGPRCVVAAQRTAPNEMTLRVSDTGPGPSADLPHIGMGTRIVQAYVDQLKARIETKSDPSGYVVEVIIPLPVQ